MIWWRHVSHGVYTCQDRHYPDHVNLVGWCHHVPDVLHRLLPSDLFCPGKHLPQRVRGDVRYGDQIVVQIVGQIFDQVFDEARLSSELFCCRGSQRNTVSATEGRVLRIFTSSPSLPCSRINVESRQCPRDDVTGDSMVGERVQATTAARSHDTCLREWCGEGVHSMQRVDDNEVT